MATGAAGSFVLREGAEDNTFSDASMKGSLVIVVLAGRKRLCSIKHKTTICSGLSLALLLVLVNPHFFASENFRPDGLTGRQIYYSLNLRHFPEKCCISRGQHRGVY
jgi:hypothetical protein